MYLSDACLGRRAGHEIRVYDFVRLDTLGCFKIIQMYAAMVAHLRLARATPTRLHVLLLLLLRLFDCRSSMPWMVLDGTTFRWCRCDVRDNNNSSMMTTVATATGTRVSLTWKSEWALEKKRAQTRVDLLVLVACENLIGRSDRCQARRQRGRKRERGEG